MGYPELAALDIAAGRLVQPFEKTVQHPWSYYIVVAESRTGDPNTETFCDWLRSEIGSS